MLKISAIGTTETFFIVHVVSRLGQLVNGFRLTSKQHGVCSLLAAKCRAEEMLAKEAGSELVMIVTEGAPIRLDKTQRLVLSKVTTAKCK